MMEQSEREKRINAYVVRQLAAFQEERDGDLRVQVSGRDVFGVTYHVSERQDGVWKSAYEHVSSVYLTRITQGYFCCRDQNGNCGDYRKKAKAVYIALSCEHCGVEYTCNFHRPTELEANGYCTEECAINAGMEPSEARRQANERMIYIGGEA